MRKPKKEVAKESNYMSKGQTDSDRLKYFHSKPFPVDQENCFDFPQEEQEACIPLSNQNNLNAVSTYEATYPTKDLTTATYPTKDLNAATYPTKDLNAATFQHPTEICNNSQSTAQNPLFSRLSHDAFNLTNQSLNVDADPYTTNTNNQPPLSANVSIQDTNFDDALFSEPEDEPLVDDHLKRTQGRRKIKMEYLQDRVKRHITFSKRKAGIMKKARELATLTGSQVLLLLTTETGMTYSYATAKMQPIVTEHEGRMLIEQCLKTPLTSLDSAHQAKDSHLKFSSELPPRPASAISFPPMPVVADQVIPPPRPMSAMSFGSEFDYAGPHQYSPDRQYFMNEHSHTEHFHLPSIQRFNRNGQHFENR